MISQDALANLLELQNKAFSSMLSEALSPILAENELLRAELSQLSAQICVLTGIQTQANDSTTDLFDENGGTPAYRDKKRPSYAQATTVLPPSAPISLKNKYAKLQDLKDHLQLTEKSKNCVLVGALEMDTDEHTANADETLIASILLNADINRAKITRVFRHGQVKKEKDGKKPARILKIKTDSEETREALLKSFRHCRPDTLPSNVYMRRDLTLTELQVDWELRQECRDRNMKSGLHQFIVRDLLIIELKGPLRPYASRAANCKVTDSENK